MRYQFCLIWPFLSGVDKLFPSDNLTCKAWFLIERYHVFTQCVGSLIGPYIKSRTKWLPFPYSCDRDFQMWFVLFCLFVVFCCCFSWKILNLDRNFTQICPQESNWLQPALVLAMAWCLLGAEPLPKPMLTKIPPDASISWGRIGETIQRKNTTLSETTYALSKSKLIFEKIHQLIGPWN